MKFGSFEVYEPCKSFSYQQRILSRILKYASLANMSGFLLQILLTGKSINFLRQVCQDRTTIRSWDVVKAAETHQGESWTWDWFPSIFSYNVTDIPTVDTFEIVLSLG